MTDVHGQGESVSRTQEEAEILAKTRRIFGNAEHGLTVAEIAEMLYLQVGSVKIYLRDDKRRIDLYRRLFEQDEAVTERAIGILESRRVG
jgi:DNA-binding CsgD family transcriptional regulator